MGTDNRDDCRHAATVAGLRPVPTSRHVPVFAWVSGHHMVTVRGGRSTWTGGYL